MLKKNATKFLLGSLILCCGCVQDDYDLNKDILLDVTISGNKITLPVSNFKPILLDSLIDVNDIDILENLNGVYSLKKTDVIDPIDIDIDPIKINIDSITHKTTFQFDEVTIDEAVLNKVVEQQNFGIDKVSIEDLNTSLPRLGTNVPTDLLTPELKAQIENLKKLGSNQQISLPINYKASTGTQQVGFQLDYDLPKEIKEISNITLNNLIRFKVSNPKILSGVKKTISFSATFPEGFVLGLDKSAPNASKYSLSADKRTINITGIEAKNDEEFVQFYIHEIVNLGSKQSNGKISLKDNITYQVDYDLNGTVNVSAQTDLSAFKFIVEMNHKVTFEDAQGSTNDIDVEFEPLTFDFSAHFNNLKHIKEVEYIEFNAANSIIQFTTNFGDGGFAPFNLKKGSQLKLTFPENFVLDLSLCKYPEGVTYDKTEHAFFISDINKLNGFKWSLALDRINVYTKVEDGHCDLNATATISAVSNDGNLKLGEAKLESLNSTLETLKDKNVIFTMAETHLHIDDAVVMTETIHETITEHTSFNLDEKIDEEIERINSIEFSKEVPITLSVEMTGTKDIKTNIHLNMNVVMPSFLELISADPRVTIKDDTLKVVADYNPQDKKMEIKLKAKKIVFDGKEFPNGLELEIGSDKSRYLKYDTDLPINGEAYIDETEMHSTILGKDISINVNINIAEIDIKKFSGIYCGKIDPIHESIDFDLGEDLDFLKDKVNSVKLSDPQIMFTIDNPVGVPVDMDLTLIGKDDQNKAIETSRVNTKFTLDPAEYINEEVVTRDLKFLLTNKPTAMEGYKNIVVPELSNLLKQIPNALDIELIPTVNTGTTHFVDLSKEMVFHPAYDIVVPLSFDSIHIEYTEVVEDLNKDLADPLQHFANIGVKAKMNIRNTIPVGLTLTAEPIDIHGKIIEGVEVQAVTVAAGNGEKIDAADTAENPGEEVVIVIKSQGHVLHKLDKLNLLIKGDADQTVGGKPLTPEQGVHITNVVLEVIGDFDTNLEDL